MAGQSRGGRNDPLFYRVTWLKGDGDNLEFGFNGNRFTGAPNDFPIIANDQLLKICKQNFYDKTSQEIEAYLNRLPAKTFITFDILRSSIDFASLRNKKVPL